MSRPEASSTLCFGYYVTCGALQRAFGLEKINRTGWPEWTFMLEDEQYNGHFELLNEICRRIGAVYSMDGSYEDENPVNFVIGVNVNDPCTLEDLMRKEDEACEIGTKLRALGLEVEGMPKVMSSCLLM